MGIARTLETFLQAQDIRYEALKHRYAEGAYDTARCAQVPAHQLLKGVVFRDEDLVYTMAIVPSHHRVLRHTLNDILGRHLELADEDELDALFFDCAPGAIPALGQAYGINIVWDHCLTDKPELWLEAGDHYHLIRLQQPDFRQLMLSHLGDSISRERRRFSLTRLAQPGADDMDDDSTAGLLPPTLGPGSLPVWPA